MRVDRWKEDIKTRRVGIIDRAGRRKRPEIATVTNLRAINPPLS